MARIAFIIALLFAAPLEEAESIDVRYRGPVYLKSFDCQDITRSSLIERVCYDEANRYMVVRRNAVHDQYCELPKDVVVGAVGGVSDKNLAAYGAAGIRAFGLGSSLYRPGMTAAEVRERALASVSAYDHAVTKVAG